MANKQKKTQKEMYNELLALCQTDEQRKFVESRLEQLAKKSASKKLTEAQESRLRLANAVYEYMEKDKLYTVTDLIKEVPDFQEIAPVSNQFATAVIGDLKKYGKVTRKELKGRAYFTKVVDEGEGE